MKTAIERANAAAAKQERGRDAKKAMQEYQLQNVEVLANMERLRALRLARDTRPPSVDADRVQKARAKKNGHPKCP